MCKISYPIIGQCSSPGSDPDRWHNRKLCCKAGTKSWADECTSPGDVKPGDSSRLFTAGEALDTIATPSVMNTKWPLAALTLMVSAAAVAGIAWRRSRGYRFEPQAQEP